MTITCKSFFARRKDRFLGFANLKIEDYGFELRDCTVYETTDGIGIGLPMRQYTDSHGQQQYVPIVRFTERFRYDEFHAAAVNAVKSVLRVKS